MRIVHSQFLSSGSFKLYALNQNVHWLQPSTAVLLFYTTQKEPKRSSIFLQYSKPFEDRKLCGVSVATMQRVRASAMLLLPTTRN